MKVSTLEIIKLALRSDETVPGDDRARLVRLLTQPGAGMPTRPARVIRFKDAAARLGCAVRTVRSYVEQGRLDPVKAKERAIGVTESSLERMINDGINGAADRGGNDRSAGLVPAMA